MLEFVILLVWGGDLFYLFYVDVFENICKRETETERKKAEILLKPYWN